MPDSRRAALSLAVTACVVLAACGGAQSRFAAYLKRGDDYLARGDMTKASVEFRNALQIYPRNDVARLKYGEVEEKTGKLREAVGLYQAVVDSSPDNTAARASLARVFVVGGAADRALTVIEPGLAKHPDDVELLTYRAAARVQLKNEAGAAADADRALQLSPGNEEAIAVRAGLYRRTGDIAAATTLVTGAVDKHPDSVNLREMLADLCESSGDAAGAERQLREVVRLQPNQLQYRERLALFYTHTKRLDDAQHVLEGAVGAMPADEGAKLALVEFMATQRGPKEAEQSLRNFIAREPDNDDLRLSLGDLLLRSGQADAATKTYDEVIRRDETGPKGFVARDRLAAIAFTAHRYDEARKLIDQVLEKSKSDPDALGLHAQIALMNSDPASAIGDFRAILRDHPQSLDARRQLARAYVANGEASLAVDTLREAHDLAPTNSPVCLDLAQVLLQVQRTDEAVALLEKAVQAAPTEAPLRQVLADAYLAKHDFAAARRAADDLQTAQPNSAAGPYLAGLAAEGLTQQEEAQKQFEHALALEPNNFDVLSALARLEEHQHQGAKAIALAKSAADREPNNAQFANLLGQLYLANGSTALADATLTRATTLAPKWWIPYRNLAIAKLAEKDTAGAITAYQAGIKAAPAEPQIAMELALYYQRHGRPDDAISIYETLYRANPHVPAVANDLAMLLVTYKKDRPSLDRARDLTAAFADSKNGSLLDTNGWVHFKRAEYDQALPVLQRASELDPGSPEIRAHLGLAELHAGRADLARHDLETAVAGSANFSGVEEARAALALLKPGTG